MAIFTGSRAVLLDAVYDGVEFFMLLPSIFLIPLLYRPSNEAHPFGYTGQCQLTVIVTRHSKYSRVIQVLRFAQEPAHTLRMEIDYISTLSLTC